ncbi:hypothetical protein GOP47_0007673 [Adiantum capillus-veneris]|uniref:Uncharacterized protein n=1 Tax=Adiantum capillus-veneris TaxID=13818 RepID=A0A9D4V1A3_ADICA|nr:hypothetical protein GOP47_0007673 [Adiantum capillus-veneris]
MVFTCRQPVRAVRSTYLLHPSSTFRDQWHYQVFNYEAPAPWHDTLHTLKASSLLLRIRIKASPSPPPLQMTTCGRAHHHLPTYDVIHLQSFIIKEDGIKVLTILHPMGTRSARFNN